MNVDQFMHWFDHLFPPLMILILPLFCVFVSSRPESQQRAAESKRLMLLIWLLAIASLAIYFVVYTIGGGGHWRQLWMLCFLQMPLMNKLLMAKNPSYVTPYAGKTRAASLTNRESKAAIPTAAWASVWLLWAALGAISTWGFLANELPLRLGCMIALFSLGPALILAAGPRLVKIGTREPEPINPSQSKELIEAYDQHRNARKWMFFSMPMMIVLLFGGCSVAVAWLATTPRAEGQIGLYGGIAGTVVGIAGGIVGTYFGAWRAKLNQRVRDLTKQQQDSMA